MARLGPRSTMRRECLWTAGAFLGLSLAFTAAMDLHFPHWTDREYAARRQRLHACLRDHPDRPILAAIGGSRVGAGFIPEVLPPLYDRDGRQVIVVNCSHLGAGPRMNLLQFERLLRDGIRPRWLLVEIIPAHLGQEVTSPADLSWQEVVTLRSFGWRPRSGWTPLEYRWNAPFRYRHGFLFATLPPFATGLGQELDYLGGRPYWLQAFPRAVHDRTDLLREVRWQYRDLLAAWQLDPSLDRTVRRLLDRCRDERIATALILFPESSEFRSWYGPGVAERIDAYLSRLQTETGLPLIDLRALLPDESFHDQHHPSPEGARRLTLDLQSVLETLIQR